MELQIVNESTIHNKGNYTAPDEQNIISTSKPFIEANTFESTVEEIRSKHIIPVFIKDNERLISHADFVDITSEVVAHTFHYETILKPNIRLSHPIKGRTPEGKDKPGW